MLCWGQCCPRIKTEGEDSTSKGLGPTERNMSNNSKKIQKTQVYGLQWAVTQKFRMNA